MNTLDTLEEAYSDLLVAQQRCIDARDDMRDLDTATPLLACAGMAAALDAALASIDATIDTLRLEINAIAKDELEDDS